MRVKIGETWYDSDEQPICIQVNEAEQQAIADMDRSVAKNGKFGVGKTDSSFTPDDFRAWIKEE